MANPHRGVASVGLGRDPGSGNHGVLIKRHHRSVDGVIMVVTVVKSFPVIAIFISLVFLVCSSLCCDAYLMLSRYFVKNKQKKTG